MKWNSVPTKPNHRLGRAHIQLCLHVFSSQTQDEADTARPSFLSMWTSIKEAGLHVIDSVNLNQPRNKAK